MRCATAAEIKSHGKYGAHNAAPREGSRLRAVYDRFLANKGVPIEIHPPEFDGTMRIKFADFYGLDIRLLSRGYVRNGYEKSRKSTYVLAGEWFGRVYIDYIAEKTESSQ